jgi:hypothetical protein
MSFDPSMFFTSVGTLVSVWILVAMGALSLVGVRWLHKRGLDRRVGG